MKNLMVLERKGRHMRMFALSTAALLIWVVACRSAQPERADVKEPVAATRPGDEKESPGAVELASPDGGHVRTHLAYSERRHTAALVVEEFDKHGNALKTSRFPCNTADNAVMEANWLAPRRMLVTLHVNPDLCPVMDVDLETGKSREYFGYNLAFDARLERVAYVKDPPHFGRPPDAPSIVMVGNDEICEVPLGSVSSLWWNPEGTVLTAKVLRTAKSNTPHLLVIEFKDGKEERRTWYEKVGK
jgi:hypothetical protein